MDNVIKTCILVVGPESSGTRWLAGALSQHPDIIGPSGGHEDPLDEFWSGAEVENIDELGFAQKFLLTRRSVPSGHLYNSAAEYMEFDDLSRLKDLCRRSGYVLQVLITVRSAEANISSWESSRVSAGGSRRQARTQYLSAYRHLMKWLCSDDTLPFWFYSFEAVLLEGNTYINSLYRLLGLSEFEVSLNSDISTNIRRYIAEHERNKHIFAIGEPVKLVQGSLGLLCKAGGWAAPELKHSWTSGEVATLLIALQFDAEEGGKERPICLCISLKPYLYADILKSQPLNLLVNDEVVYSGEVFGPSELRIPISLKILLRNNPIKLRLFTPNATRPASVDQTSGEQKQIALAVSEIIFSHEADV